MTIHIYKTYRFQNKDPIIDQLRTIVSDSGLSYESISERSGVSKACLWRWFHGGTKRPQHATIKATARALGWDYRLVEMSEDHELMAKPGHNSRKAKAYLEKGQGQ